MVFTVRLIAASVLCMTVVLAGGLVTACTGAPSATVPTPTGRSIDAPPPPSSTAASSAVANVYRRDHAGEEPGLDVGERARLRGLERKYREVKLENEFLKKAAAYFAQDPR